MNHSTKPTNDIRNEENFDPSLEDERFGALQILIWMLGGAPKRPKFVPSTVVKKKASTFASEPSHPMIQPAHVS